MAELACLKRVLAGGACGNDYPPVPESDKLGPVLSHVPHLRWRECTLAAEPTGEAAVQYDEESARRDLVEQLGKVIEIDHGRGVGWIDVHGDEAVIWGAVPGERHHDEVIGVTCFELAKSVDDPASSRSIVRQERGLAAEAVGEQRLDRVRVASSTTESSDRRLVAIDADEHTAKH